MPRPLCASPARGFPIRMEDHLSLYRYRASWSLAKVAEQHWETLLAAAVDAERARDAGEVEEAKFFLSGEAHKQAAEAATNEQEEQDKVAEACITERKRKEEAEIFDLEAKVLAAEKVFAEADAQVQGCKDKLRSLNAQGTDTREQKQLLGQAMDVKQGCRKSRDGLKDKLRVALKLKKNAAAADARAHADLMRQRTRQSDRKSLSARSSAASRAVSGKSSAPAAGFSQTDTPLQYVPVEHRDREVVLAAVSRRPVELAHAPAELQGDKAVALAAAKANGRALKL